MINLSDSSRYNLATALLSSRKVISKMARIAPSINWTQSMQVSMINPFCRINNNALLKSLVLSVNPGANV
jgi:hypothetical protein